MDHLKKTVAAATVAGALSFSALGLGASVANADDDHGPWVPRMPWQPREDFHEWVPWVPWQPWQGDQGENEQ